MDKNGYSVTGFGTSSVEFKSTHLDVLKIGRRCHGVFSGKGSKYRNIFPVDFYCGRSALLIGSD